MQSLAQSCGQIELTIHQTRQRMRFGLATLLTCLLLVSSLLLLNLWSSERAIQNYKVLPSCSPTLVDPRQIKYQSDHWFYTSLKSRPARYFFPPPLIYGHSSQQLCNGEEGNASKQRLWEYCLPTSGLKDPEFCKGRDRMDLLAPVTSSTRCFSSVLHMIFADVYADMVFLDLDPALLFKSRQEIIQDSTISSLANHIKLGFSVSTIDQRQQLQRLLTQKGYHTFQMDTWHVCVAPTHPLASNLYDPSTRLFAKAFNVPSLDLYELDLPKSALTYADQNATDLAAINDNLSPFSQVTISGIVYNSNATQQVFRYLSA